MNQETLVAIVAIALSLFFSYVPGAADRWDVFNPTQKRGLMAVMLVLVSVAVFGLSCANIVSGVTCDKAGALGLVQVLVAALVANQAAFALSPKRSDIAKLLA